MVRDWTMDQVSEALDDGTIALVDVREAHEFAIGHIPGSISMPLSQFDAAALPHGRTIVFSCAAGVRSLRAIVLARASGVEVDSHYPGGFKDWFAQGGMVDRL